MRILIHTGTTDCANLGDAAMLKVAVSRFQELNPRARIQVLTDRPAAVMELCPGTECVPIGGLRYWAEDWFLFGRLHRLWKGRPVAAVARIKTAIRKHWPTVLKTLMSMRIALSGTNPSEFERFNGALRAADLIVAGGQGSLTDTCAIEARQLLTMAELAAGFRKPIAFFGQGVGPLEDPDLCARAADILPKASIIGIREGKNGISILKRLNVSNETVVLTGDDAIELAYDCRRPEMGDGLGINVRISRGAGVTYSMVEPLRPIVLKAAEKHNCPIIPIPISIHEKGTNDAIALAKLFAGWPSFSAGCAVRTPQEVIHQIGSCRVVVTGAYHAAVFALSQGIPAVCLWNSQFHRDKFVGLAEQFSGGCEIIQLTDGEPNRVSSAIDRLWDAAPSLRERLRASALDQIARSRSAYARFKWVGHTPQFPRTQCNTGGEGN